MSINKAILIGNVGSDVQIRYTPSGAAVANFTIATNESYTDKNSGQKVNKAEWHRIVAFGKLAEICGQYLTKGKQVYIEGKIQTRSWDDKDGNKRYTTEIVANSVQMLGTKGDSQGAAANKNADAGVTSGGGPGAEDFLQDIDDVPF